MSSPASILIVEDTGSIAIVFQKWLKSIGLAVRNRRYGAGGYRSDRHWQLQGSAAGSGFAGHERARDTEPL